MKMVFTLFCREFGNVVNRAFLVLIFWVKNLVGANFIRFCNYVPQFPQEVGRLNLPISST